MREALGVVFNRPGKIYYFLRGKDNLKKGNKVIGNTIRGIELGEIVVESKNIDEQRLDYELKNIIRKATTADIEKNEVNAQEAKEAFDICLKKIKEHKLPMKLIDSEYTFDKGKLLFYFTADGRIDFRELVKDLASIFRTRIELRQIGVRDETKMLGGIGQCGRKLCCKTFLREFAPITIKMAKDQDLSLNPEKISGICGRLMCCLRYECNTYCKAKDGLPEVGDEIVCEEGTGEVISLNIVKETVVVKFNGKDIKEISTESIEDIKKG